MSKQDQEGRTIRVSDQTFRRLQQYGQPFRSHDPNRPDTPDKVLALLLDEIEGEAPPDVPVRASSGQPYARTIVLTSDDLDDLLELVASIEANARGLAIDVEVHNERMIEEGGA